MMAKIMRFSINRKMIVFFLFSLFSIFTLDLLEVFAAEHNIQEILSHLYRPSNQAFINDMTIALDISIPAPNDAKYSSDLVLVEKSKIFYKNGRSLRTESDHWSTNISSPMSFPHHEKMIFINNGIDIWILLSNKLYPVKTVPDNSYTLYNEPLYLPFGIIRFPNERNIEKLYAISGTNVIDNITTTVIKIYSPTYLEEEFFVFIDTLRCVPLIITYKRKHYNGKDIIFKVLYKDIKTTSEGRFFPFRYLSRRTSIHGSCFHICRI